MWTGRNSRLLSYWSQMHKIVSSLHWPQKYVELKKFKHTGKKKKWPKIKYIQIFNRGKRKIKFPSVTKMHEKHYHRVLTVYHIFLCKPSSLFLLNSFLPCSFFLWKFYFNIKIIFIITFKFIWKHAARYFFSNYVSTIWIHSCCTKHCH